MDLFYGFNGERCFFQKKLRNLRKMRNTQGKTEGHHREESRHIKVLCIIVLSSVYFHF